MKDRQETGTSSKEIVARFWKALFSRDPEHIRSAVTPDVEWTAPPENATAVALGITHHMIGPDAIIKFVVEDFRRLFSNGMNVDIISVTAEENRVVFEQKQRATLAQGQQFDLDYVFIFETRDGRVSRVREYMDTRKGHMMVFGGGDMRVAP
jgi:hypothetical protein